MWLPGIFERASYKDGGGGVRQDGTGVAVGRQRERME